MNAYAKNGNVGKMSEKESPLLKGCVKMAEVGIAQKNKKNMDFILTFKLIYI